jgi:hypothetical protein
MIDLLLGAGAEPGNQRDQENERPTEEAESH